MKRRCQAQLSRQRELWCDFNKSLLSSRDQKAPVTNYEALASDLRSVQPVFDEKVKISPVHPNVCALLSVFILPDMEAFKCKIYHHHYVQGSRQHSISTIILLRPPYLYECIQNTVDTMKA